MGPHLGSMGVDKSVECGVWLKVAAQVGLVAQVRCDEFLMHQTAVILVKVLVNGLALWNILIVVSCGLRFGLVEYIDCAHLWFMVWPCGVY